MHIDFVFHNLESSEAMKSYALDKIGKLQKYLRTPIDGHVTFSVERHLHCVDVTLNSGSEHHQARAEEADMYASIDVVVDKIHRQINRIKEQHNNHRRGPLPGDSPGE
jgi:putative sigma-54 modulation protein